MMKVLLIAGARPNFMKIAPIYREALKYNQVQCKIVHTGQHYDYEMSEAFFEDLELPKPDFFLSAGSGTHAFQTAKIMVAFEELSQKEGPDLIIVVGDVNSTLACSVVAKKLLIDVAHVEAGLRSFDLTMPEEINRMVTDAISDYFFVTEESGAANLVQEGKSKDRIHFVGNVMIDNLFYQVKKLDGKMPQRFATSKIKEKLEDYAFLTLHRPSNVDTKSVFCEIAEALNTIADKMPIIFPVHPRTKKMMDEFGLGLSNDIYLFSPLSFKESLFLWKDARVVLTDSGGLQEETTALGVPCVTIRENTERPITIKMGTNILAGTKKESILKAFEEAVARPKNQFKVPPKWDGKAAERIWKIFLKKNRQD
ncbi:MAG: UDP-N-acetylglucosamine 2-epimerase (non-hydrolysing) [Desulfobacteraceae bacterium Eth-SRB2]|nr:MAG: UDP-N-acetylglucosamine 2-epimerase (non-hydrolysing) [Desulfobacteraceae bacterium Eth-SRB2]